MLDRLANKGYKRYHNKYYNKEIERIDYQSMTKQRIQKTRWKAGNMIYPLPAVMVSCGNETETNIVTVAWTGTICTNPPMTYISLRPSRYSYDLIKASGYFAINLTTESLVRETDFCGVKSGRDVDKFKEMHLTCIRDEETHCPMIEESPVSIVCETVEIKELGSHHMFIANVKAVYVDESYMDEKGKFHLNETGLIAYSHGSYLSIGEELGTFGYSISKKKKPCITKSKKDKVEQEASTMKKGAEKSTSCHNKKVSSNKREKNQQIPKNSATHKSNKKTSKKRNKNKKHNKKSSQ